jgi:hypothetical protein
MSLEDGVLGACTPWSHYSVPELAGFLAEDLSSAWDQVVAWHQTLDLIAQHQFVLQQLRDQLAEVWPPAQSPASAAFVAHIDSLVASLGGTFDAVAANRDALAGVIVALETARRSVDAVHVQWQQRANAPVVSRVDLVTDWREPLNQKAATAMRLADATIAEFIPQMKPLPTFTAGLVDRRVPVPSGAAGPDGASTGSRRSGASPSPGGVGAAAALASVGASMLAGLPSVGARELVGGQPGSADASPVAALAQRGRHRVGRTPATAGRTAQHNDPPAERSWSRPGTTSPSRARSARRYGGAAEAIEPAGSIASEEKTAAPVAGMFGGGAGIGRNDKSRTPRRRDRVVWEVPQGVPPVLEPATERTRHDPGPGVIGIDL